ncbi:MAG TPA: L-threonylcarbamoyladenylate synthase [Edaphobacter sp.]|nr:L-threonylcarbamoyladenylate synthase [Edaphobacter sp.]
MTKRLQAADIEQAAQILRDGGTVAFPTETVYGLGANALDSAAVAKIFAAKGRPAWDPLIVHVASGQMLDRVAMVTPQAEKLIESFWPGPLTLLLERTAQVPDAVTAGRALAGVRMPSHPLAFALIRAAGVPIAAPSANRFGHTSPTTAAHVLDDLDGRIDAVLDGGSTTVGVESTVLDPAARIIYRPGAITPEMLEPIIGPVQIFQPADVQTETPQSLPSPGVGIRHYAPRATVVLVADEAELRRKTEELAAAGEKSGILLPTEWPAPAASETFPWAEWNDHNALAQRLFLGLRELDSRGVSVILCPLPPAIGVGIAIRDRLEKAARIK